MRETSKTDNRLSKQAERLKTLRKEKKQTQEKISEQIGCGIVSYRNWEKGKCFPDTVYLIELSKLFDVSCDYILGLTDFKNIGNKEVSEITSLSDEAVEVLRYLSRYKYQTNKNTISLINRVLKSMAEHCRLTADNDGSSIPNILATMEEYIASEHAVASIGDGQGQFITFHKADISSIHTVQSLYLEKLSSDIRKILDRYREIEKEGEKDNA